MSQSILGLISEDYETGNGLRQDILALILKVFESGKRPSTHSQKAFSQVNDSLGQVTVSEAVTTIH